MALNRLAPSTPPSALDYCEPETIELVATSGVRKVDAHRYGLLAVHRCITNDSYWTITHLPSGQTFMLATGVFTSAAPAASAMLEIARLKNDWLHLDPSDLVTLGQPIADIGQKHGGLLAPATFHAFGKDTQDGRNAQITREYE